MSEFDPEPGECRECVDDESTAIADVVVTLVRSGSTWVAQST
jgi:hypothetical protein